MRKKKKRKKIEGKEGGIKKKIQESIEAKEKKINYWEEDELIPSRV